MPGTDGNDVDALGQRIDALIELRRHAEARTLASTALEAHPEDAGLHAALAQCSLALHDPHAALVAADACVRSRPDGEHGHRLLSKAYAASGNHLLARLEAEEAVRLAPHNWLAHLNLAMMRTDTAEQKTAARETADTACRLAPHEADAHFVVGLTAAALGDTPTARAAYERALALDPSHSLAQNNLTVLGGQWRMRRAVTGFLGALRQQPDLEVARKNLSAVASTVPLRLVLGAQVGVVINVALGLLRAADAAPTGLWPVAQLVVCASFFGLGAAWVALTVWAVPRPVRRYFVGQILDGDHGRKRWLALLVVVGLLLFTTVSDVSLPVLGLVGGVIMARVAMLSLTIADKFIDRNR